MSFEAITNRGEFFSDHYLDAVIGNDLKDLRRAWDDLEGHGESTARSRLRGAATDYFDARATVSEATTPDRQAAATQVLNDVTLTALGLTPERTRVEIPTGGTETLEITLAHDAEAGTGRLLVALDAGVVSDVDELFDDADDAAGLLVEPAEASGEKDPITSATQAVGELFATDDPPRYVVVAAGHVLLLAKRSKWAEGRYLSVDLDAVFERLDTTAGGELDTVAGLFSTDALVPGSLGDEEGRAPFEDLVESSFKHAVGVSKDLRHGMRQSVEILANEVIRQRLAAGRAVYDGADAVNPTALTHQCLRWLYRLVVLLYAESRPELGVVPVNDEAYLEGYSLDRLRELTLVDLDDEASRNGTHLHESLRRLFGLVNDGYHAEHAEQALVFDTPAINVGTREEYLQFPGLDAGLFDDTAAPLLDTVTLRNEALQKVLALLMLSPEGKGRKDRGFISYAQLGINQLGAVYEGLMAYSGFFATDGALFEVAKNGDPSDGTWVLPVDKADEYPDDVFVTVVDPITGREERVRHDKGSFVYRLSGRDRQRSASYYTPELLTRCVVKHALAELLGLDEYAPENGSSGITRAEEILDLTICEPALGSGAFLNEAINQLSGEYLRRRQEELDESLDPERYRRELQKVKAHFALHQCYGVDLNATAVELAEVSLWLNCMHPGLKAPWFGLQLRRGNSLVGCRRATWRTGQLVGRPWANTKKGEIFPPEDRPLAEELDDDEIHHFLLPGHGWAAVADRKEAKEFRPDEVKALKDWRKKILRAPGPSDAERLTALASAVEEMWARAAERTRLTQQALRRPIDVYGATVAEREARISRSEAERVLGDPDSALGRLRTLMDAWAGLWFWPVDGDVEPPTWKEWLDVAEELLAADDRHGPSGQLGFEDLEAFLDSENDEPTATPVAELREEHPWLDTAVTAAQREGAWHWELEFAPVFRCGGFDLQVGNPPWHVEEVDKKALLAEIEPGIGVGMRSTTALSTSLGHPVVERGLISSCGTLAWYGSPCSPFIHSLSGSQNAYRKFIEIALRHTRAPGTVALLHPTAHLGDQDSRYLRRLCRASMTRLFRFINQLKLFADIGNTRPYSVAVYSGRRAESRRIETIANLFHPSTIDETLYSSCSDASARKIPGLKTSSGEWQLRGHPLRLVPIDSRTSEELAAALDPGTAPIESKFPVLHTRRHVGFITNIAKRRTNTAGAARKTGEGNDESSAVESNAISVECSEAESLDGSILQAPNIGIGSPLGQESRPPATTHRHFRLYSTESGRPPILKYESRSDDLATAADLTLTEASAFVCGYKRWIDANGERTLQACLLPGSVVPIAPLSVAQWGDDRATALAAATWSGLPTDFLVRSMDRANLMEDAIDVLPESLEEPWASLALLRYLRLNCISVDFAELWSELYEPRWKVDSWTGSDHGVVLGDVQKNWNEAVPLRSDASKRSALVEVDAITAHALGLDSEALCLIFGTGFSVLEKYEDRMRFDAEGRKICGYHQSAGYRQARLQEAARGGVLPKEWESIWKLYEQYEEDPSSVDWLGHYTPPFTRPDREKEMTRAYEEFQRRLDAGEYG